MIGNHVEGSERLRRRLLARKNLLTEIDHALAAPRIGQCRNRALFSFAITSLGVALRDQSANQVDVWKSCSSTVGISDGPSSDPL
jgi:hypothetical protein